MSFDREGDCRVEIVEYTLKEFDSGAVAVAIRCKVLEWFGANEENPVPGWYNWRDYGDEVTGDIWVVSGQAKGNKLLDKAIQSLVNYAGWDGSFDSIANGTWQPTPCQVVVTKEKDQRNETVVHYRASFVNDYNRTPGGLSGGVKPEQAKALQTKYGQALRAIVGNKMRNQPAPAANSRPASPPKPAANNEKLAAANSKAGDDGIPF